MCGIIGYTGPKAAAPLLLDGLRKLEYRGYDSAGIATICEGSIQFAKTPGKITNLLNRTHNGTDLQGPAVSDTLAGQPMAFRTNSTRIRI